MTLKILKNHNLSGTTHGFFTRLGGESTGIYEGLNCGLGSMDDKKIINRNRMLVAESMGINQSRLVFVHQIHSGKYLLTIHRIGQHLIYYNIRQFVF